MLVLSRKLNESIRIGDDIVIKVVHIRPGRIRLGIDAPSGIRICRMELVEESIAPILADFSISDEPLVEEFHLTDVPAFAG